MRPWTSLQTNKVSKIIWNECANIPGWSLESFKEDSSSRTRYIMDKLIYVTKSGNEQTDWNTKIWSYSKVIYKHPWNISRKFEKDSSSRTGDITDNLFSVGKWGNKQTDRHKRNLKIIVTNVQTSPEYLQKIWKKIAHPELEISLIH